MRHQGNKERFVKGLYKAGEKRKKDQEEERREMRGVEAAAARAYALDVGAGRAGPSSAPALVAPKPAAPPPKKPSNPYANYTTAEFLGYTDPDAERLQAELERKRTRGVVGDWEAVPTTTYVPSPPASALDGNMDVKPSSDAAGTVSIGMKREAAVAAVDADDEDSRAWKLRKKTATLGDIYDPGLIPIKIKARTKLEEENIGDGDGIVSANIGAEKSESATGAPKWTKIEWKRAATDSTSSAAEVPLLPPEPTVPAKTESDIIPLSDSDLSAAPKSEPVSVKLESALSQTIPNDGAGGSLFKKRKVPAGGAGRGRRAQF